mmetsp:Transcript_137458/g.293761  ORF Transcript_137458/g.293761 Transcript_137458/m.293761 type:complete len:479 (-) Transcript_137458:62-1498(-)
MAEEGAKDTEQAQVKATAGKSRRSDAAAERADGKPSVLLPPAASIFQCVAPAAGDKESSGAGHSARVGNLLGLETPMFLTLTSRGMPLHLRPQVSGPQLPEGRQQQLYELPVGDVIMRQDSVAGCPKASLGCRGFWPHLEGHLTYCSFRNPTQNPSVFGGDAVCSVETSGGRRKVGPRELLDLQRVMRMDIVAAPAEEVSLDVVAQRRLNRAISRAADWLKEMLEGKATEPELGFDWHVLAGIQGGGDVKLRQKACAAASAMPVAGFWIGGLGYDEGLLSRARILEAVTSALPPAQPRFLPLCEGTPLEVLQAVLLGVDVLEITYPQQAAFKGIALLFSWEMPPDAPEATDDALASLLPPVDGQEASKAMPLAKPLVGRQLYLRSPECREDFGPISADSPVSQYSRAYLYHLLEVRELLGTMLLAQHNLYVYSSFFAAMRDHIRRGTLRRFVAWFVETQTCELTVAPTSGPPGKRRKI